MRKIIISFLFLSAALVAAWQCSAQIIGSGIYGDVKVSGGGGGPTWTSASVQAAVINSAYAPASFSVTLASTPSAADQIMVVLGGNDARTSGVGLSVNSTSCALVVADAQAVSWLFQCTGITSSSLTVAYTCSAGCFLYSGVAVGVLHGLSSPTETATGYSTSASIPDPQCLGWTGSACTPITVPSAGYGIVGVSVNIAGSPTSTPGVTVDADLPAPGGYAYQIILGHTNTAGSWNPEFYGPTGSGFSYASPGIVAGTWH